MNNLLTLSDQVFTVTVEYTDQAPETSEFNEYNNAVTHARNELKWENTLNANIVNDLGILLFSETGSFH